MTDPRRMSEEGATEFETALLKAGRRDAISDDGRRRVLSSFGVGAAILTGTAATGATGIAKAAPLAAGGTVVKYIAIGGVAAVALWGGVRAWNGREAPRGHGQVIAQPISGSTESAAESPPRATAEVEAKELGPVIATANPATTGAGPAVKRLRSADAPSERSKDSLPKELSLLDRVRRELASGNPRLAHRLLDEYEGLFPNGRLATEATVLRIESLARAGDRAGVAAVGKEFLTRHPNGPYATRVRSMMGDSSRSGPDAPEEHR
jgi:hypothetical protein